jgi:hypothetical protein
MNIRSLALASLLSVGQPLLAQSAISERSIVPAEASTAQSAPVVKETTGPTKIDFSHGFAEANGPMQFNGGTLLDDARLIFCDGSLKEAGSAFYATPINIQSFTTDFTLLITHAVADGLTFTIQNVGPGALGGIGGSLGYEGIGKSVAIKFDLHSNLREGPDSTGLYIGGESPTIPAINLSHTGIDLHSGDRISVHITYNVGYSGGQLDMRMTDQITDAVWSNSFAVDIPGAVGGPTAYVGFTGSTGELTSEPGIVSWTYEVGSTTP